MTEAEWLSCDSPEKMLYFLHKGAGGRAAGGKALARKARLFACACMRHALSKTGGFTKPWQRPAVEAGEAAADGLCGPDELRRAKDAACGQGDSSYWAADADTCSLAVEAALHSRCFRSREAMARCCRLVRCVFGDPFRPAAFDPA